VPGNRTDAAERDARTDDRALANLERARGRNERELVRRAVAHLEIRRACSRRRRRNVDADDQIGAIEIVFVLRRIAGKPIERVDRNASHTVRTFDEHDGVERHERDRHVARMRRDTMRARPQDRVRARDAAECGAARTRIAPIARERRIAIVRAARAL
jgi:hypothetical protein